MQEMGRYAACTNTEVEREGRMSRCEVAPLKESEWDEVRRSHQPCCVEGHLPYAEFPTTLPCEWDKPSSSVMKDHTKASLGRTAFAT